MELLSEDEVVPAGATPAASVGTGANTTWEMATVVFNTGSAGAQTVPAARENVVAPAGDEATHAGPAAWGVPPSPRGVHAVAGDRSARVTWTAPKGGGPIPLYTVTPYRAGVAQAPTVVSGSPAATTADVTGLTDARRLHLHRDGHQRRGERTAVRRVPPGHAEGGHPSSFRSASRRPRLRSERSFGDHAGRRRPR